jgi:broad specificity phosphatase PhoE
VHDRVRVAGIYFLMHLSMKIVLIRHFRVDFKWRTFYNSREYSTDREGYNNAAIVKTHFTYDWPGRVVSSTMARAMDTSALVFQGSVEAYDELCEVPLVPFIDTNVRLPKIVWDVVGRLQWRFNNARQPETYSSSKSRVRIFLNHVISEGHDVVMVCHGWVIKLLIKELKRKRFVGPDPLFIKNGYPYVFTR